jgi:hypothetical protein
MPLRTNRHAAVALLLSAVVAAACGSDGEEPAKPEAPPRATGQNADGPPATGVFVVYADDVHPSVRARVATLLGEALGGQVQVVTAESVPERLDATSLVVAIGDTAVTRGVIPAEEASRLAPEAFVVRKGKRGDATVLAADGRPAKRHPHGNLGALHGAYALLEELGFAFLHPLAPVVPRPLRVPTGAVDREESPRWDAREIHYHSQHPLELTELLQGFGPNGTFDQQGWEAMLPEWDRYMEWLVANGQNGIEWFLLWAQPWADFADSDVRLGRLKELVDRAHAYSVSAGVDAPIAFAQQHSYRLLRQQGELEDERAQIRARLDWLDQAGWDFYGIESGTSEFTAPDATRMLAWMNEVARHLDEKHGGKRAFVKVHCSAGQTAQGYPDPKTGQAIDFNMLPHFADERLGVLPHTVQTYGLTDPAPTYGNASFGYIRDFLRQEAGSRPVIWYPESAYWVSFDVDVPLFLPLYGERRLADLRLLARDEEGGAKPMDGQLLFSSGWEWGYWLNDVMASRAAWDPGPSSAPPSDALKALLGRSLRVFGAATGDVVAWIADVVAFEQGALIEGKVGGEAPKSVVMRNGHAYMEGWETWDDVNELGKTASVPLKPTQPSKLGLVDMRNPLHGGPGYSAEVEPLLAEMETRFAELSARAEELRAVVPLESKDLFDDLADAMKMTALRARQVHGLYDYVDGYFDTSKAKRLERLGAARKALDDAGVIVAAREARYRVPADRIAGWRKNPTAYAYGYLWTVRSLHYWWRDEGKAVDAPLFPCYMNIVNPVDVAFGEGMGAAAARWIGQFLSTDQQRGCLAEPSAEPKYPEDGLRSRP